MPIMIDTQRAVARFRTFESLAFLTRVSSTNAVARSILDECVSDDRALPQAMIVAGEQFAGRGRHGRTWSSPRDRGIYATLLLTRSAGELPLIPLELANIVSSWLRETFAIDARLKWPNDVIAAGRKIAGILTEARVQDQRAHLVVGIGVNLEPVSDESLPNATSIREQTLREPWTYDEVVSAFVEHVDSCLARPLLRDRVLGEWREHTIHRLGDPLTCVMGQRTVSGTWLGIDDEGRALLQSEGRSIAISAGEFVTS